MKRQCPNCLLNFEPNSGKQKFCSDKCKVAFARKTAKGIKGVTTADKIPEPYDVMNELAKVHRMAGIPTEQEIKGWVRRNEGMKDVEDYCFKEGILPQDLIDAHRNQNNLKTSKKQGKEVKVQDLTKPPNSNWRKEYIKNKTGISL